MSDTIAAIATPPGRGGVGIVRVSGSKCKDICFNVTTKTPEPRIATFTAFLDASGAQIDQGLSLYFNAPKSFTGEDVLELHAHGGPVVMDLLLRRVVELGARLARAGEFTERAFLNNKIDLLQAEAVAELINASSEQAAIAAVRSLQGEFSNKIKQLVESLIQLRLYVEAAIDFPDEEIDFLSDQHVHNTLANILEQVGTIHTKAKQGVLLSEGINTVIIGQPNVGKSTLLNNLTGQETAIVTPIAGTTRDTIKATINLDGIALNIIDTAGLRTTNDVVEQEGIKRALQAVELADLILLVEDITELENKLQGISVAKRLFAHGCANKPTGMYLPRPLSNTNALQHYINDLWDVYPELKGKLKPNAQVVIVCNKVDKTAIAPYIQNLDNYSLVAISAQTGSGMDLLRAHIKQIMGWQHNADGGAFLARRRHLDALQRAQNCLITGKQQLHANLAGELLADELKHAQLALNEITGEFTSDDLLGRIFSEFCIGK